MHKLKKQLLAGPYLIWIIGFIILPLFMIIYYAFSDGSGGFTIEYITAITTSTNIHAILLSLKLGILCTLVCLLLSYPLAMILNGMKIKNQSFIVFIFMLPMWMNFILRIYAWVLLLQNDGLVDLAVHLLGLDVPLLGNAGAVVLGMVYNFLPFMVLPIHSVMLKIDNRLVEAAQDLGAGKARVFSKVIFPLSIPGIISGITMVFVPTASTFLVAQYLGGTGDKMIGDVIENIFQRDKNVGSAISLALMIIILIFIIIMNKFGDEEAAVA